MSRGKLVAAAVLAGVVLGAAAWAVRVRLRRPRSAEEAAREARIAAATRVLSYPIEQDLSLEVALLPQDRDLRLLTNLDLTGATYAATLEHEGPAPTIAYGLRCEALDAQRQAIWSAVYWARTRKTVVRGPDALGNREEAFGSNRTRVVCDTRATHLMVGPLVRRGARWLRVSIVRPPGGDTTRVLARVLRATDLDAAEAQARWDKLSHERREKLVSRLSALPAELVPPGARLALVRRRWFVAPAEPHAGKEHQTAPLYLTDLFDTYRPPPDEVRASATAGPLRRLALNVVGPATVGIEIGLYSAEPPERLLGPSAPPGVRRTVRVDVLREDGVHLQRQLELERSLGGRPTNFIMLPIEDGPATVTVHPETFHATVRFYLDQILRLDGLEVQRVAGAVGSTWEVRPEIKSLTYFEAVDAEGGGSGAAADGAWIRSNAPPPPTPIEAEIVPALDGAPTDLRIACRVPIAPDRADRPAPVVLRCEVLDAGGHPILERSFEATTWRSDFDWLARERELGTYISDPVHFRLRLGPTARRIRLWAPTRTLCALFSRLVPEPELVRIPESLPLSFDVRARGVERGRPSPRVWYYYRPINEYALGSQGRSFRVYTPDRLLERTRRRGDDQRLSALDGFPLPAATGPDSSSERVATKAPAGPANERLRTVWRLAARREGAQGAVATVLRVRAADRFRLPPQTDVALLVGSPADPAGLRPAPLDLFIRRPPPRGPDDPLELLAIVYVDGREEGAVPLPPGLAVGRLLAGAYPAGEHRVRVELFAREDPSRPFRPASADETRGVWILANHPPQSEDGEAARTSLLRARTTAVLERGDRVAFDLRKPEVEALALRLQVFGPVGRAEEIPEPRSLGSGPSYRDELRVRLRRLERGRVGEVLRTRTVSVARASKPGALDEAGGLHGQGYAIPWILGTDLEPGRYRVELEALGAAAGAPEAGPLLVRLLAPSGPPPPVSEGYFARFNLVGPTVLRVAVPAAALRARGAESLRLVYRVQGERALAPLAGSVLTLAEDVGIPELATALEVPEGLHTVTIGTLAPALPLRYSLLLRGESAHARVRTLRHAGASAPGGPTAVFPEERRQIFDRISPGEAPLVLDVDRATGEADGGARRALRLVASVLAAETDEALLVPFRVRLRFVGGAAASLGEAVATGAGTVRRGLRDLDDTAAILAEPDHWVIVAPTGTRAVAIEALDRPTLVRLETGTPGPEPMTRAPRGLPGAPREIRVRSGGDRGVRWRRLEPRRSAVRSATGQRRRIARAVHLVTAIEAEDRLPRASRRLVARGAAASRAVLERLRVGAVRDPGLWTASHFVRLHAGDRVPLRVVPGLALAESAPGHSAPTRLATLVYDLPAGDGGAELRILVDGKPIFSGAPLEPRGRLPLRLSVGEHAIEVQTLTENATLFLNLAPTVLEEARPFRERALAAIPEDGRLEMDVEKGAGPIVLSGAIYLPAAAPPGARLRLRVQAPKAARRSGVLAPRYTALQRQIVLGAGEVHTLYDLETASEVERRVHAFQITLGPDLAAGRYRVVLTPVGLAKAQLRMAVVEPGRGWTEKVRLRAVTGG